MDTTVTAIGSVVVAELRAAGYRESTIGQYKKTIKALTCFVEGRGGSYTPSLGASFASMTISRALADSARSAASTIASWSACSTPTWPPAGWSSRAVNAAGVVRDRLRVSSPRWLRRGRPTWTIVVWCRPPATPMGGWPAPTWSSWLGCAATKTLGNHLSARREVPGLRWDCPSAGRTNGGLDAEVNSGILRVARW